MPRFGFTRLCALILVPLFAGEFYAQPDSLSRLGAGFDICSSGNTHGAYLRLFAGIERRRNLVVAGPMLQLGSGKINGGRITWSRNLSARPERARPDAKGRYSFDRVQLNLAVFLQYIANAPMSPFVTGQEQTMARHNVSLAGVRMSTAEAGLGIELRLNLTHRLCWFNTAGTALHWHTRYAPTISREKVALTLGLVTGVLIVLDL